MSCVITRRMVLRAIIWTPTPSKQDGTLTPRWIWPCHWIWPLNKSIQCKRLENLARILQIPHARHPKRIPCCNIAWALYVLGFACMVRTKTFKTHMMNYGPTPGPQNTSVNMHWKIQILFPIAATPNCILALIVTTARLWKTLTPNTNAWKATTNVVFAPRLIHASNITIALMMKCALGRENASPPASTLITQPAMTMKSTFNCSPETRPHSARKPCMASANISKFRTLPKAMACAVWEIGMSIKTYHHIPVMIQTTYRDWMTWNTHGLKNKRCHQQQNIVC